MTNTKFKLWRNEFFMENNCIAKEDNKESLQKKSGDI